MRPSPTGADNISSPRGVAYSPDAARSASATSARMRLDAATNDRPASVKTNARLDRLNNLVSRCASSSDTLRLTVANGDFCRRAASDKLPASATARTTDMASKRSIGGFHFLEECISILADVHWFRKDLTSSQKTF